MNACWPDWKGDERKDRNTTAHLSADRVKPAKTDGKSNLYESQRFWDAIAMTNDDLRASQGQARRTAAKQVEILVNRKVAKGLAARQPQIDDLRSKVDILKSKVEGLMLEIDRLKNQVDRLKSQSNDRSTRAQRNISHY